MSLYIMGLRVKVLVVFFGIARIFLKIFWGGGPGRKRGVTGNPADWDVNGGAAAASRLRSAWKPSQNPVARLPANSTQRLRRNSTIPYGRLVNSVVK